MKDTKRLNRVRIEWSRILTPTEYMLLDKIMFQANLTEANNGNGYVFHVRQLAKELNLSTGIVSQSIDKWPFMNKRGVKYGMAITFDYNKCLSWLVHKMNNGSLLVHQVNRTCSPGEPISKKEEVHVPNVTLPAANQNHIYTPVSPAFIASMTPAALVESVDNTNETMEQCSGVSSASQSSSFGPSRENVSSLVHQVNKANKVRLSGKEENNCLCKLPRNIKNIPSAIRQRHIVGKVNDWTGFNLRLTANGYKKDGFSSIAAIDEQDKSILITADTSEFLDNGRIQEMVLHFMEQDYNLFYWSGDKQAASLLVRKKEDTTPPCISSHWRSHMTNRRRA